MLGEYRLEVQILRECNSGCSRWFERRCGCRGGRNDRSCWCRRILIVMWLVRHWKGQFAKTGCECALAYIEIDRKDVYLEVLPKSS